MTIEDEFREQMDIALRSLEPGMIFRAKAMRRYRDILIACGIDDEVMIRSAVQMWLAAQNDADMRNAAKEVQP